MLMLVVRDLQYRKMRVLVIAVLVSIVVTLLFVMTGLVNQFNREPVLAAERAGGEHNWLVAETSTGPLTSASAAPDGALDGVAGAEPMLIGMANVNGERATVIGRADVIDEPALTEGRYPSASGEVLIDEVSGFAIGQEIDFAGSRATVVGLTSDATVLAGVPLAFTQLDYAQEVLVGGRSVVTGALVAGTPENIPAGMKLMTPEEVGADGLVPLLNAISSVDLVRALLWLITLIIIAAVIFITAIERTRDFAVLKAVGAKDRSLALSLIVQGVIITLLAAALAAILQVFIAPLFPMTIRVPAKAFWQIPLGGVIVALLAGIAGARRVANTPAAEAFE
ncbi:MAG: FtsX-like permease family protein [Acidimicrobiales bacterium]|nr:FtsX-like permease family protein [Acidimicrobiales bacterium]RZV46341.1 MAG: FtsX-like permease family protein [Acidimicrobiales bacterium]